MGVPTWLRFPVPVDGVYRRKRREPPSDPPRRHERHSNRLTDSQGLPQNGPEGNATSGSHNKWIYIR
jgi:hypothetical protein